MLNLSLAGNLGRDAEFKTTQNGKEFCSFSVGVSTGYGDNKQTTWVDVTRWGKGADGLARILRKGSKVAVTGEMSTREHNGKTYLQVRADNVTIMGTPDGQQRNSGGGGDGWTGQAPAQDYDDGGDIPFVTRNSIW